MKIVNYFPHANTVDTHPRDSVKRANRSQDLMLSATWKKKLVFVVKYKQ